MQNEDFNIIIKLRKDLKEAAKILQPHEARYLVDLYYQIQDYRKTANNQIRENKEPNLLLTHFAQNYETLEKNIRYALDIYTDNHVIGKWMKSIIGIGPVISAGLLAHIDITKAKGAGAIWKFAGLDPTAEWKKGEKRPWNADLKTLCWKIGESFVKISGNVDSLYGKLYVEKKEYYQSKNEKLEYQEQTKAILEKKKIGKDTDAYKHLSEGKLPPAQIHARAKRYAVKIFLAHLFEIWYKEHYGIEPPMPYVIAIMGHKDWIKAERAA